MRKHIYSNMLGLLLCSAALAQLNQGLPSNDYLDSIQYNDNRTSQHAVVRSQPGAAYNQLPASNGVDLMYRGYRVNWKNAYAKPGTTPEAGGRNAFSILPIYQAQAGYDAGAGRLLTESALGFDARGDFNRKIGYTLRAAIGQTVLPDYLDSFARKSEVMPGWGDRAYALDSNGRYGWQHISGYISWQPSSIFNLQLGRDKQFWGEGYRSLWLSDIGAAFPYLQQSTKIWKLQYTSLFAIMEDRTASTGSRSDYRRKYGTFHVLSWNATKWLNLQAFEAIIWQGTDSNRYRGFDVNYLNPLAFFRPIEYSLGSSDNAMLGFGLNIRLNANNRLYGQLILDEFFLREIRARSGWWANKYGLQMGWKSFNLFHLKGLNLQGEINLVRPYTYAHGSPQQSYTHAGMPLAHILGANFSEGIGMLVWEGKQLFISGKMVLARFGQDTLDKNFGGNPFLSYSVRPSEFGNEIGQGLQTNLLLLEGKIGWRLRMAFPLRFELTAAIRRETTDRNTLNSAWFMAGLKLTPFRTYRDF